MTELRVLHRDPTLTIAVADNLQISVWRDAPTLAQMRAFSRAAHDVRRVHSRGAALFNAVLSGTPRFTDEVREEARRLTMEGEFTLGVAHVILVGGLGGVAARAFLATVVLLGRPREATRVFGEVPAAASWLAAQLALAAEGPRWTGKMIADAYDRALSS